MPVARWSSEALAQGMSFKEVKRDDYDLGIDDFRTELKFVKELVEQRRHHPLLTMAVYHSFMLLQTHEEGLASRFHHRLTWLPQGT
jgi:hypothetical protein